MRHSWLLLLGVAACKKDEDPTDTGPIDTDTTPEDTDTEPPPPPGPDLVITDPNDYTLTNTWTLAEIDVRAAYDVVVNWSALTTDAWGAPFDVVGTEKLILLDLLLDPEEVAARFATDDFGTDLSAVWEADAVGKQFVPVSDLHSGATPFDPEAFLVENPNRSWVAALANMDGDRYDILAAVILVPTDPGGSTQAAFVDGSSSVTWSATLNGVPLETAEGWDEYTLDWKGLVTDALGRTYDEARIDQLFLASFDESATELAAEVWNLEALAEEWFTMDILDEDTGRPEIAHDKNGNTFPGFTVGPTTWLVGTQCTAATCFTRFPAWLVDVDVVPR
jgi:hypothetical protein